MNEGEIELGLLASRQLHLLQLPKNILSDRWCIG